MEQKLVMAHVFGHADFFVQERVFQARPTGAMVDTMANHATRVHRHVQPLRLGQGRGLPRRVPVRSENLVDPMAPLRPAEAPAEPVPDVDEERWAAGQVHRFEVRHRYMDPYLNPKDALEAEKKQITEQIERRKKKIVEPTRDVLGFLLRRAPLADWQADCLDIVREEAYYFAPQAMTKILNEGWASWVHSKLMTTKLLSAKELVDYCDKHSGTLASPPGQINPYRLGLTLLREHLRPLESRCARPRLARVRRPAESAGAGTTPQGKVSRRSSKCAASTTTSRSSTPSSLPSSSRRRSSSCTAATRARAAA